MRTVDRVFLIVTLLVFAAFVAVVLVYPHTPWAGEH